MNVRFAKSPWTNGEIPNGLTLFKEYEVVETFNSNIYDEYYRIIDDNGEEQAWGSWCFEEIEEKK